MENTINHRISLLITSKGLNPSSFSKAINQNPQTTHKILKGLNNPSYDYIQSVLSTYSDIAADWLVMGREMSHSVLQENDSLYYRLEKEVDTLSRIQKLQEELFSSKIQNLEDKLTLYERRLQELQDSMSARKTKSNQPGSH